MSRCGGLYVVEEVGAIFLLEQLLVVNPLLLQAFFINSMDLVARSLVLLDILDAI